MKKLTFVFLAIMVMAFPGTISAQDALKSTNTLKIVKVAHTEIVCLERYSCLTIKVSNESFLNLYLGETLLYGFGSTQSPLFATNPLPLKRGEGVELEGTEVFHVINVNEDHINIAVNKRFEVLNHLE